MALIRPHTGLDLDGFILGEQMTSGGMGSIWHASHPDHPFPLVVKIPFFAPGDDVATIVGYEVEEMIMRRLSGPHVPKFVGAGDLAKVPYIAMEFIDGTLLEKRLDDGALSPQTVASIGQQVARALDSLHRQGVIHLDLKPANIIMAERGAVLIDFGLARHEELPDLLAEESHLPMGSAPYIAPEQVLGSRATPASDIFALGAILYELTTGQKPFGVPGSKAGMERRLYQAPKPPRAIVAATPRWLQEIILKCLEIDPARRYSSAAQLRFDLQNPEQVVISARGQKTAERGVGGWWRRLFAKKKPLPFRVNLAHRIDAAPIVLAAVDLSQGQDALAEDVRLHVGRVLAIEPDARLACLTVLKTSLTRIESDADEQGRSAYIGRLVTLKDWAGPLNLPEQRISFHVIEAVDPGSAIVDYAQRNDVDQIVMGARAASALRRHLGSVSAKVVAEAHCSVMVVRSRVRAEGYEDEPVVSLGDPPL